MTFRREQYGTLVDRLNEPPRTLTFVTGPRQSGKTTLIQQALDGVSKPSRYVAVDEPDATRPDLSSDEHWPAQAQYSAASPSRRDARWLVRVWEQARVEARHSASGFVLALDEIQRVADWSAVVKGLWDADRRGRLPMHVVLAGSAPLLMQQGLVESLAGRFETLRLTHWSFSEMADAFDLDLRRYVYFGGYPRVAEYVGAERRWRDYVRDALVAPNIERDVLAMQRVDKPALLKQLFELGTAYSGQVLPYSKMLGQLQDAGNTTTLARYVDLLEKAGLLAGLDKYQVSEQRRRASPPKLNVLNTALIAAHGDYTFAEAQADRSYWGRLVESAVGAHLCNTAGRDVRVYYWRDGQHEVDFVLERARRLIAIEVKSSRRQGRLAGLEAFRDRFVRARTMLVGADGTPIEEFLSFPAAHWFEE